MVFDQDMKCSDGILRLKSRRSGPVEHEFDSSARDPGVEVEFPGADGDPEAPQADRHLAVVGPVEKR